MRIRHRGFSYVEVLVAMVLMVVLLVPAMQALQSGLAGTQSAALLARELNLRAKMETVLAKPFGQLYAETYAAGGNTSSISASLSDAVGTPNRRNVVLYRYDASNGAVNPSGADTGLLLIAVYYEADGAANGMTTLLGRWW
jgi:prepilin-type N-terminal cleavage/methylation domain-containing protein